LSLLLAALYNKIFAFRLSGTENQNGQPANAEVLNNTAGPSNVRRVIVQNVDNDYDSSSDDENPNNELPTSVDVTRQLDVGEPAELDAQSRETLRKSLQSDIKQTV